MRLGHNSKSCQILTNRKIFNFKECQDMNTAETTPNSTKQLDKPLDNYFKKYINPDSQMARELHEASVQAHWFIDPPIKSFEKRKVELKKEKYEKVVVLDLDETLVQHKTGQTTVRPYCNEFLERLSTICTVVLFTAASSDHAINMLKIIDPQKKYFKAVCSANHMIQRVKDLRIFSVDLKDILIVENSPKNFSAQINNGVPILPFEGSQDDNQLQMLLPFLEILLLADDVRIQLADIFQLHLFYKQLNGRQAINNLYKNK